MRWRIALMAAGLTAVASIAAAAEYKTGDIAVVDPWARASAMVTGAAGAYLTLRNDGDQPDRLLAVSSAAAPKAALHRTVAEGNVMKMVEISAIDIPAHGTTTLKPGDYHLMLIDLKTPLRPGDSLPLTLRFERAGTLSLNAAVMGPGAMGPGAMGTMEHGHGMANPMQK